MMEQLTLINEYNIAMLYACGVAFSLILRFVVLTISIYINQNTRLKETKNITKKTAKVAIKYAYLSFVWPLEVIIFAYKDIKFLIAK
jgi:TRAP-type C4-dicarboxylate transport system permease large subunit